MFRCRTVSKEEANMRNFLSTAQFGSYVPRDELGRGDTMPDEPSWLPCAPISALSAAESMQLKAVHRSFEINKQLTTTTINIPKNYMLHTNFLNSTLS